MENEQEKKKIELVDNALLKKISKKKYYIQPTYIFVLFIIIQWFCTYVLLKI